ncbi:hypothetical protein ACJJTC_004387 [Scirpophaga incertulas]
MTCGVSMIGSLGKGGGGVPTTDSGCQPPRATQGHSLSVKVIATPARTRGTHASPVTTNRPTYSPALALDYRNTRRGRLHSLQASFLAWANIVCGVVVWRRRLRSECMWCGAGGGARAVRAAATSVLEEPGTPRFPERSLAACSADTVPRGPAAHGVPATWLI